MRPILTSTHFILLGLLTGNVHADVLDVGVRAGMWLREGESSHLTALMEVSVGWEELLFGRSRVASDPVPPEAELSLTESPAQKAPSAASDADEAQATGNAPMPSVSPNERPEHAQAAERDTTSGARPNTKPGTETERPEAPLQRPSASQPRPVWLSPAFAMSLAREVMRNAGSGETVYDSLGTRSRASAALPVLRLRAGRGIDESLRYSPTTDDPDRWLASGGADLSYEAQATWTLDRLVFADDEVAIERLRVQARQARTQRVLRALEVLFRWQASRVQLSDPSREPDAELQLTMIQAEIELDVLTRGWFSRQLQRDGGS